MESKEEGFVLFGGPRNRNFQALWGQDSEYFVKQKYIGTYKTKTLLSSTNPPLLTSFNLFLQ